MKKKVTVLLLAFCLVLLAVACGEPSPADAVKADLEDAKSSPEEILEGVGSEGFGEEATQLLIDKMLDFDYELGEEAVNGDSATVELSLTTYPFGEIFTTVINNLFNTDMTTIAGMTEDGLNAWMDEMLISELNAAEKTYTADVTVELEKVDGHWAVQESEELSNAITGGMMDFASGMLDSLAE